MRGRTKTSMLMIALFAACLGMRAQAGFEQFGNPVGEMNVYDNNSGTQGGWLFWSGWGVADLQALTGDNRTFELLPNINAYNDSLSGTDADRAYWTNSGDGGVTPGPDGNKFMEASTFFELSHPISSEVSATFTFDVTAFDLDPRYTLVGFVKVLDPLNDYQPINSDQVVITATGTNTITISTLGMYNKILRAGWTMTGLNAASNIWGSATITATELYADNGDVTPPMPDPMTFATVPYAISDSSISMTATTATDDLSSVEYYFACTAGGGHDSGWQSSTNYIDTGLAASTEYTYTVMARDTSVNTNQTAASAPASATTFSSDTQPPSPDPMTFDATDASPISIKLTATTATDASAIEYYFTCTSGDGHDSGWQSGTSYIDTGLTPGSNYAYTVTARDLSADTNTTAASSPVVVATMPEPGPYSFTNTLQGLTGNTDQIDTVHELAKLGLTTGSLNPAATISFSTNGATFGQGVGYPGRNLLKTIALNYGDVNFEAYATLTFSGASDLSGYIGMGQGIQTGESGNWGVPELNLSGVNGVFAEFKDTTAGSGIYNNSLFQIVSGVVSNQLLTPPVSSTETIRAKLVYSADSNTVSILIDKGYTGGPFEADQNLGTISTLLSDTNGVYSMWTNAPVRIYVGGGEGTVVKDFEVISDGVPPNPTIIGVDDLVIQKAGGGMMLTWSTVVGQSYDVQYKTDLTSGSWTSDPSPGCSGIAGTGGSVSATSTIGSTEAFYQISTQ